MNSQENYPIRAVKRAFDVIEYLHSHRKSTLSEIADGLEMNMSTVHNHLRTLEHCGYVIPEGDEYRLGLQLLNVGTGVQESMALFQTAKDDIEKLASETGEQVNLVVEEKNRGRIIYQRNGEDAIKSDLNIGSSFPLHCTAAGKVILAEMDRERARAILESEGMESRTKFTITDPDRLFEEFEGRERGNCVYGRQEWVRGVMSVAAPVILSDQESKLTVKGAVSICAPYGRLNDDEYLAAMRSKVDNAAHILGINLSYD